MATFDRLLSLAKKTGDRLIVFDSHTGDGFAAIPLDEYESMVSDQQDLEELDRLFGSRSALDGDIWAGDDDDMWDESGWQSTGDILTERYRDRSDVASPDWFEDDMDDTDDDEFFEYDEPIEYDPGVSRDHELSFDFEEGESSSVSDPQEEAPEPTQEPVPPMIGIPPEGEWQEEPLDEDPIFFEEPIE